MYNKRLLSGMAQYPGNLHLIEVAHLKAIVIIYIYIFSSRRELIWTPDQAEEDLLKNVAKW